MTPAEGRAHAEKERARAREDQRACRANFLFNPGHDQDCICDPPCSRDYDPHPYPEAEPTPLEHYVDTGIGALYGGTMHPHHAVQLAGWNIKPRSRPE